MDEFQSALTGDTAPSESPPDETEHLDNTSNEETQPETGEAEGGEPERDDAETVETDPEPEGAEDPDEPDEPEDEDDDPDLQRGNVPYKRFQTKTQEARRYREALEKAGFRLDPESGEPVPIGDGWDVEESDAIPPEQVGQLGERPDDPNEWTNEDWHEFAREEGYNSEKLDDNGWNTVSKLATSQAQARAYQRQQQAAVESQAKVRIDETLAKLPSDPYLSLVPEAVEDVRAMIRTARGKGAPYSRIATDLDYLQGVAIKRHLPQIVAAASGTAAKHAERAATERRNRLSAQPGAAQTAPPAKEAPVTGEVIDYAKRTGIDARRLAAEVQKIRGEQ